MEFEAALDYVRQCVDAYGNRSLTAVEEAILRWSWAGLSYEEMARRMAREEMFYAKSTLQRQIGNKLWQFLGDVWSDEDRVSKPKFKEIVCRRYRQKPVQTSLKSAHTIAIDNSPGNTVCVAARSQLLEKLRSRTVPLVVLTGASGIGKSRLLQTLETEINSLFSRVIHHFPYEFPSWHSWHREICDLPADAPSPDPKQIEARHQVLQALRQQSHLIVLEQGEHFIDNPDYRGFIQELKTTIDPKSCILWVTSIRPHNLEPHIPVEEVTGYSYADAKNLLLAHYPHLEASLSQNESQWQYLNNLCGGNASLLHKSVEALKLYANQIEQFIADLSPLPPSLSPYFDRAWEKLTGAEQTLMYWLTFYPLSQHKIRTLRLPFSQAELKQAWATLHRRHFMEFYSEPDLLCQLNTGYFRLYLLEKLQAIFTQEFEDETLQLFHQYPLTMPQGAVDHQQDFQRYLLKPLVETLQKTYVASTLEEKFGRLLSQLTIAPPQVQSLAAGNLFNLASALGLALPETTWAGLTLWHTDLRTPQRQPYDFQGCHFKDIALMTGLQGATVAALHPQGSAIAIGDGQGWLQVYHYSDYRCSLVWCEDLGVPISDITITHSGRLVVTLMEQTIRIWDDIAVNTCDELSSGDVAIYSIGLRPDNYLMAAGVSSGQIYMWDLLWPPPEGKPLPEITDIIKELAFSPDGKILAGHDHDHWVWIWHQDALAGAGDIYTAQKAPLPLDPYGTFLTWAWIDDQLQVVEAVDNPTLESSPLRVMVRSFSVVGEILREDSIAPYIQELPVDCQPQTAVFSDNGKYLALCDINHKVYVWHRLELLKAFILPVPPHRLSISNDGQWLLSQNADTVSFWSIKHQQCLRIWETVSDLDQYSHVKFYRGQGLSEAEIISVERLGAIIK